MLDIKSARRLGKRRASTQNSSGSQGSSHSGSQGVQCRLLLVSCNPWFLRKCLAKSYKLQNYEHRIYFKKHLTSSEGSGTFRHQPFERQYGVGHMGEKSVDQMG